MPPVLSMMPIDSSWRLHPVERGDYPRLRSYRRRYTIQFFSFTAVVTAYFSWFVRGVIELQVQQIYCVLKPYHCSVPLPWGEGVIRTWRSALVHDNPCVIRRVTSIACVFTVSNLEIRTCMRAICWFWRMVGWLSSTLVSWAVSLRERGTASAVSLTEWRRKTSKSWLRYRARRPSPLS